MKKTVVRIVLADINSEGKRIERVQTFEADFVDIYSAGAKERGSSVSLHLFTGQVHLLMRAAENVRDDDGRRDVEVLKRGTEKYQPLGEALDPGDIVSVAAPF